MNDRLTIRAALEAAGEAVERVSNGHASRYEAAAAVAAFLRALPTAFDAKDWPLPLPAGMHVRRISQWSVETMWRPQSLASAVEEAARDG